MEMAWFWGLLGGLLIGTASAMHLLLNGRIAGLSGMLRSLYSIEDTGGTVLNLGFLVGAFAAALAVANLGFRPVVEITTALPALIASGVLVGVGVSYAGGCTSGHGVSGLSRLSPRSLVATACFMAAAVATVTVARHVLGFLL